MPDAPHFAFPFRWSPADGHAMVVEQDSQSDVAACVEAILRTPIGWRPELPGFGLVDPTFTLGAIDTAALLDTIETSEPRAHALIEEHPDALDALVRNVAVTLEDR